MDGRELSLLIDQRWTLLKQLLQMSERQIDAIQGSRMTELMGILSEKQIPMNQLSELASRLRPATKNDPKTRVWETTEQRDRCREQQEECESMHLELLAIEAQCETSLVQGRDQLQQELQRVDNARQAVSGYGSEHLNLNTGGQLDLSSDG